MQPEISDEEFGNYNSWKSSWNKIGEWNDLNE